LLHGLGGIVVETRSAVGAIVLRRCHKPSPLAKRTGDFWNAACSRNIVPLGMMVLLLLFVKTLSVRLMKSTATTRDMSRNGKAAS
jgi:hypothetical protein